MFKQICCGNVSIYSKEIKFLIYIITLVFLIVDCDADKHTYGTNILHGTKRTLIDDHNTAPKNYTIIYKFVGGDYRKVQFIEIDVNVPSSGYISSSHYDDNLIEGRIHIDNALHVIATISSYTYTIAPTAHNVVKSLTFIYVKDAIEPNRRNQFAQNSIGRRQKYDKLIYFESRNVTNGNRFPSRAFEYLGNDFITYVGFSFNSPTATVLVNTSYVGEQEFNAVVYDMNTDHFVANMSVYGINSLYKPSNFQGVIYNLNLN